MLGRAHPLVGKMSQWQSLQIELSLRRANFNPVEPWADSWLHVIVRRTMF